jgi:hypothetical protein
MRAFRTVARERGVTTIPVDLRQTANVETDTELTWVEIEPQLWLVGPRERHPEEAAPIVAAALRAEQSPFPKLMRRWLTGAIPQRTGRGYRRMRAPALSEEQMIALGEAAPAARRRRGRP